MKTPIYIAGAVLAAGLAGWYAFTPSQTATAAPEGDALVTITLPDSLSEQAQIGKRGFDAVCAACHSENAVGRDGMGPPLVHKIYEPSHHGDMSFQMAVQNGVRAHHWTFGNMPPQNGLTRADVTAIVAYVRELQRANGIN
ncbi:MAG: cytochrome C [Rhodobacteraceae bacterium]|nr:cytochrome C [Paracoccaceae bacterium]